jgi:hypothetical protein
MKAWNVLAARRHRSPSVYFAAFPQRSGNCGHNKVGTLFGKQLSKQETNGVLSKFRPKRRSLHYKPTIKLQIRYSRVRNLQSRTDCSSVFWVKIAKNAPS